MPDPATDQSPQSAQSAQPQPPPMNTTVTVNAPSPAPIDTASNPPETQLTPPDVPTTVAIPGNGPTPLPQPPKESFGEGFRREANPQYTTDAEGNVIRSESVRTRSKLGILGGILAGALEGATRGMAAQPAEGAEGKGAAFSAAAKAAIEGRIAADQRARDIAQRNFQNRQAAIEAKVKQNLEVAQTLEIQANMEHQAELFPVEKRAKELGNETAELQIRGARNKLLEDAIDFKGHLATDFGIDPTSFTEHSPEFTAQAPALVHGAARAVHNGQTGDASGIDVYPTSQLEAQLLTKPETYNTYDGAVDKDGVPIPTTHVMTPDGKLTANDYMNAFFAGQAQLVRLTKQISARMTMQQHQSALEKEKAGATEEQARAGLENAQARTIGQAGIELPQGFQRPSGSAKMDMNTLKQSLQSQGVQVPNDFDELFAIAHYKGDLDVYPTRTSARTGQKDRRTAVNQIRQLIDPNFEEAQYKPRQNFLKEYESTTRGAGASKDRANTAVGHLNMLAQASTALARNDVRLLNSIANAFGVATGASPKIVYDTIAEKAAGEAAGAVKGGNASATDAEIKAVVKTFDSSNGPRQQLDGIKAQLGLLRTQFSTIANHFQQEMGETPSEFGAPVAYPSNQEVIAKWFAPTGAVFVVPGNDGKLHYADKDKKDMGAIPEF